MAGLTDRLDAIVGAKAARLLDEVFGMSIVADVLRHYPRKYSQGMTVLADDEPPPEEGDHITVVGEITSAQLRMTNRQPRRKYLVITVATKAMKVTATFFNATFLHKELVTGTTLMLSGEVGYFRKALQLTHPAFLVLDSPRGSTAGTKSLKTIANASSSQTGEISLSAFERDFFPIYPASAKLQSWDIYACVRQVLNVLDPIVDPLPDAVIQQHNLMSEDAALRAIHLAENAHERDRARHRLTFDEAMGLQWALVARRHSQASLSGPTVTSRSDGVAAALLQQLPFTLTDGQRDVLDVMCSELAGPRPMNRLLQGEVGSGKTIISVVTMLHMVDTGYQCALLAPTEVLAAQHAQSIRSVLGPLARGGQLDEAPGATRITLLTGSLSASAKKQVYQEISTGQAGIVVGTHALLQDAVQFNQLGMVVIDEQHRFGVEQRDRLRAKAPDGLTPHLLVMTATPIPRTVALTVYGDVETSTLRELPRGRQPITTNTIFINEKPQWLTRAWQRIVEEVAAGRQAYIVASRIDEDDNPGAAQAGPPATTVVELYERLNNGPLAGVRLGLMHGRLSAEDKDAVMTAFRAGDIDVLVCTTVIEVGVDVPNATVMMVMDADRFGISQLHQLRGRIGRGVHPSLCLLATRFSQQSKAGQRLGAVAETVDGFALADLDVQERGEGDVLGLNQSGRPITLRFLSLAAHLDIIVTARQMCSELYGSAAEDPGMAILAAPFTGADRVGYLEKI